MPTNPSHGNYLQYVDSVMAEDIMLKFAKSDYAPVLPIHDSFIMQHAFGQSDELVGFLWSLQKGHEDR